jgi:regulator of replication initiation timing
MKTSHAILACALATLPFAAAAQKRGVAPASKKLYCWNENGIQVCGDALPPSAVDRARTEISAGSGLRTGEVPRALTPEERAAAAAEAVIAAEAAKREEATRRRDMAMSESYATEADLRRAYGERITLVEESIKSSRFSIDGLRQSLVAMLRQASELELEGKPVRPALANKILRQHDDLLRLQSMRDRQVLERAELASDLDQAVQRYREMKSAATGG